MYEMLMESVVTDENYTLAFLQPQVMFNDIKTLALEAGSSPAAVRSRP